MEGGTAPLAKSQLRWRIPELTAAEYANIVIDCIREKLRLKFPNYELVRALGCSRVLTNMPDDPGRHAYDYDDYILGGVRDLCHVNFTAKPIYTNRNRGDEGEVFIFAELVDKGYVAFDVSYYWVSSLDDPGITFGCGICPHEKDFPHPTATIKDYLFAQCDYKPPDEPSKPLLAESFRRRVMSIQLSGDKLERICCTGYETWPDQSWFSPLLSGLEYAELALKGINKKEDVEFQLEKISGVSGEIVLLDYFGDWRHISFIAKPKNDDAASSVHFFAELLDAGDGMQLNAYSRLDPNEKVVYGCEFAQHVMRTFLILVTTFHTLVGSL